MSFRLFIKTILPLLLLYFCHVEGQAFAIGKNKEKLHEKVAVSKDRTSQRTDSLIERVFSFGRLYNADSLEYTGEVYLRHNMYTRRGKMPIVRYIPGMLRLEKGTHNYLTEAQLRLQYRNPGELDCKIVAYNSTSRYQRADRFASMGHFNFNLYAANLFIDHLLNPLNHRNRQFYRYRYEGTYHKVDSFAVVQRVTIQPRFSNDQLVKGYVDIRPESGAVVHFHFVFRHNLQRFSVDGYPGIEGISALLPEKLHIVSDFRLFRNRVYEATDVISRHTFTSSKHKENDSTLSPYDLTRQCIVRIDTSHIHFEPEYIDSIATSFLSENEERPLADFSQDWMETDTLPDIFKHIQEVQPSAISSKETAKKFTLFNEDTQDIFLSSHRFDLDRKGNLNVKLPAIISPSMMQWSGSRGLSLKTRLNLSFHNKQSVRPLLTFTPMVGYAFKQKQVYWQLPLSVRFAPAWNGIFSLEAGGGSHSYNNRQANELREKIRHWEHFDTLNKIIDDFDYQDYRDAYANMQIGMTPYPGFSFTLGIRMHKRTLIEWNKLARDGGLDHYYSTLGPRIGIEWTPRQYYYRQGRERVPLYSHYPTLQFCYERGYGIGNGDTHYERIEGNLRYRLPLYALRAIYMRAGGGFYTQRGSECFIDYDFFRFYYMPADWSDELSGEFQILNSRWYNESRYYAFLTTTYESPMLLFSRIPYLTRIVHRERIYLNLLSVRTLGMYGEAGYGISTHLVNLGFFMGMAADHRPQFGFKFVFRFFDN